MPAPDLLSCDENLWELFVDQLRDFALFMVEPSGKVASWNNGAQRLSGYTAKEILGQHFSVFYTAEDISSGKPKRALDRAAREGTYREEGVRVRKDGTRFWAMVTITALRDKQGSLKAFAKLVRDVSDRKQSEARYRAVFEYSTDAILLTQPDGHILTGNPAACRLFGYSEAELASFTAGDLLDASDPGLATALAQRAQSGEMTAELRFIRRGGARFEARVASKVFRDELGCPLISMVIHDITARKCAEWALRQSEERFRLLYDNAPIGIAHIDPNGILTYANWKFAEIIGYPRAEVIGLSYLDVTPPDEREISRDFADKLLSGEIEINRERRMLRRDGGTRWIRLTAKMLRDEAGRPQYGIALFEDITDTKQAEEALRRSEEKFRATFEHAPLGIAECDEHGRFLAANPKLLDMLGYTLDELEELSNRDITHPADQEASTAGFDKLISGELGTTVLEQRYIRKDHSQLWVNVTTSLSGTDDRPRHIIAIIEDVTARRKGEEDLRGALEYSYHLANHDPLTGMANRANFNDRLKDALHYAQRDRHLVAVHMLDLDRFKSINDTLGHQAGDLLLREVARRLASNIRETDLAARLGGDEFVIVQTHLADAGAAEVLAEKIVDELGRPYLLEGQEVYSGTSIGIALYPNDAADPAQLVKLADLALYEAKNRGRYNYQLYRDEMRVAAQEAKRFERELQRALRDDELCMYYQPQFDLDNGRIAGIEALIRWHHPERGLLTATEFIQDVENANLMLPIGEWALRTACKQHARWVAAGLAVPLTLNVSSRQLRHPRFLQIVRRALEEAGLAPSLLQLEMRESVLWDSKSAAALLQEMKNSGLRLALDAFGSELTALSALQKFPLDVVKPGQELIRQLPQQEKESAILSAIVGVAHDVKIAVCAEGIETADQLAAARSLGCCCGQGYLLSPPLATADMERMVQTELSA